MKNVKFLAIGALVVGLTVGTAAGYANLQSTEVAEADTARAGVGIADVDKTTSAEEIGRSTDAARAFAQAAFGEDTSPEFRGLTINPYVTDGTVDGKTRYTRAALSFVDSEGMAYRVDKDSGKVIQVGPAPRRSLEEPAPEYDFTERYTQDDLEEMASQFLTDQGVDVEADTKGLEYTVTTKDGRGYFFRWQDNNAPEGVMRFLQVGFTVGGSLLSYTNAL